MIKVTIFLENYIPRIISSFSAPQSTQIIDDNNTQPPFSGENESNFNTFDQLPVID